MSSSIRSSRPSLVSQSAQSEACIFECRSQTVTCSRGQPLRRAYIATVIDVQEPRAASRRSYGDGPVSVPPTAVGSSALKRCAPVKISCASAAALPRTITFAASFLLGLLPILGYASLILSPIYLVRQYQRVEHRSRFSSN